MPTIFGREPALFIALVGAIITTATAFGLNLTVEQLTAINVAVLAAVGFWTRSRVTPS